MTPPRPNTQARWVYDQIQARGSATLVELADIQPKGRIKYMREFDRWQMLNAVGGAFCSLTKRGVLRVVPGTARPRRFEVVA